MKTALIFGITGQDGAYLADLLIKKDYRVVGCSRGILESKNLQLLEIATKLETHRVDALNRQSVRSLIEKIQPNEIYNLSGGSSVATSFFNPHEYVAAIPTITANILESVRETSRDISVYNAASSECFGAATGTINESEPFSPLSPYAVAKVSSVQIVKLYREVYQIKCCSGYLFNHESPLRQDHFVSKKVVNAAREISKQGGKLVLGNLDVVRDWGWAPDYVKAMWLMMQQDRISDYVICTGEGRSLKDFVKYVFELFDLDYEKHVSISQQFIRKNEPARIVGDPSLARKTLTGTLKLVLRR